MNRKRFNTLRKDLISESNKVMNQKGKSYAGDKDVFTNMKSIAEDLGLNPMEVLKVYAHKHNSAVNNYYDCGDVSPEGIYQNCIDKLNYCIMEIALVLEAGDEGDN